MYIAIAKDGRFSATNGFINSYAPPGLKVGRMARTIWVTWFTILEGQVSLICKLN